MKIALLTDGMHPYVMGGMQRHSSMLVQHLPSHGAEVVVFHTANSVPAIADAKVLNGFPEDVKANVEHVFVDYPEPGRFPGHYIRDNYQYSERLLDAYRAHGGAFDFIYAKGLTGHAFVKAKKRGLNLPPIGTNAHGYEMFQRAANLRVKLEHLMLRPAFKSLTTNSDYVFSYGGKITEILAKRLKIPMRRVIEIPTGIDPSWLVNQVRSTEGKRRFIFLGRYERRKGIEELHTVLRQWQGPEIEFVFIGPIPQAKQLNIPWVEYRGPISESDVLKAELDQGDVLVCPSYSEGMPNVIMEAMARGLAIVATDVGAVAKVVDATNGVLIPKLSIGVLRASLEAMAEFSDIDIDALKVASLRRVSKYTWEQVSEDTLKSIEIAVSESPSN